MARTLKSDAVLFSTTLLLLVIGMAWVYSASARERRREPGHQAGRVHGRRAGRRVRRDEDRLPAPLQSPRGDLGGWGDRGRARGCAAVRPHGGRRAPVDWVVRPGDPAVGAREAGRGLLRGDRPRAEARGPRGTGAGVVPGGRRPGHLRPVDLPREATWAAGSCCWPPASRSSSSRASPIDGWRSRRPRGCPCWRRVLLLLPHTRQRLETWVDPVRGSTRQGVPDDPVVHRRSAPAACGARDSWRASRRCSSCPNRRTTTSSP